MKFCIMRFRAARSRCVLPLLCAVDASTSLAWSGCWVCGVVLQCLIFYFGVALIIGISALGTGAKMLRFYILELPGLP